MAVQATSPNVKAMRDASCFMDCGRGTTSSVDLEPQAQDRLTVKVCHGLLGTLIAEVSLRRDDTVAALYERLQARASDEGVCLSLIFGTEVLSRTITLAEAGLKDGDTLQLVSSTLRCLTTSMDGSARLWPLDGGASSDKQALVVRPGGRLTSAALSPCGGKLLTASSEGVGLWCAESGGRCCELVGGEEASCAAFSPDGRYAAGLLEDGSGRIWCTATGTSLLTLPALTQEVAEQNDDDEESQEESEETHLVLFSPDGSLLLTCQGRQAQLWDAKTGQPHCVSLLRGHRRVVRAAGFSPDGSLLLTASADCTARLWSTSSGECLQVLGGHSHGLSAAAFSPSGRHMLTTSLDGTVRVWQRQMLLPEVEREAEAQAAEAEPNMVSLAYMLPAMSGVVGSAVFSPDGHKLLLASGSEDIQLFNAASGELLLTLAGGHQDWVRTAAFSPDGSHIVSAAYDGTVRVWSLQGGGHRCLQAFAGHAAAVLSVVLAA